MQHSTVIAVKQDLHHNHINLEELLYTKPKQKCVNWKHASSKRFSLSFNKKEQKALYSKDILVSKDVQGKTLLMQACQTGQTEIAATILVVPFVKEILLAKDNSNWTPLMYACKYGQLQMVQKILFAGKDIAYELLVTKAKGGRTPLMLATEFKHYNIVSYILDRFPMYAQELLTQITEYRWTVLHFACFSGVEQVVETLISNKLLLPSMIFCKDKLNRTPLMLACWHNHDIVVKQILQAYPAFMQELLTMRDIYSWTPLMLASCTNNTEVVQVILNTPIASELLTMKDENNCTSLMLSCWSSKLNVYNLLTEFQATVNGKDDL